MPELIVSPNDNKKYAQITLDNGLRVLLIQDPEANKSAAALAVNVGHFDDPEEREGMAHFLEHMLFLGTEKYPTPGDYQRFISQHGGNHNAWTGPEFTCYFFDINHASFEEGLDRFSQFFTAPLFDAHLADKERLSVDSEFKMKLRDDVRRLYQVHKQTVNPAHPFAKFSVGNLQTLEDRDDRPVREELLAFYRQHYSANLMTLVMVSHAPLELQQQWAQQRFAQVENRNLIKAYPDIDLYTDRELNIEVRATPLKAQRRLTATFPLPGVDRWYHLKPLTFLAHMLGYEGRGSLLSLLKRQGLATNLSAGGGINGYNFKDFNISFQLTEKGIAEQDTILGLMFQYIEVVKAQCLEEWRYDERKTLLDLAFRFQEASKPMDLASHLAINMQHYPEHDIIYGDYRMDKLDTQLTRDLLGSMHPKRLRLQLVLPELETDRHARWYNTPYSIEPITEQRRCRWAAVPKSHELSLPGPNPYILKDIKARHEEQDSEVPQVVFERDGFRLWHFKDSEFNVPKGHLFIALDSDEAHRTTRAAALTRLYIAMLLDDLSERTYAAEIAGLSYNIYPHQGGLTLHLTGFTGKQQELLSLLLSQAKKRNFLPRRFNDTKSRLMRNWHAVRNARPISKLFNSLTATLQHRSYEPLRLAAGLETVTLEELHEHIGRIYRQINIEAFVYGDWLRAEADALARDLHQQMIKLSAPGPEVVRELVSIEARGTILRELPAEHQDSAILVYYQSRRHTPEKAAMFSLLNHAMSSNFFHELRTKQQLGYMVGTSYVPLNHYPGLMFYIQSPVASPLQLIEAIDQFIADFSYALMQITHDQWQSTKQGLVRQILEPDANINARAQRLWTSIGNHDNDFGLRQRIAEEIDTLERADMIRFIVSRMKAKVPDRLILFSCGNQHQDHSVIEGSSNIEDLNRFKSETGRFSV
ncbi:insulinase family protein [Ferrimonas sediminicola]|uniref:Protease 3 n=1 Tax=Ferrimonas sediminicola TaxID=2569538 RepID=A0A4U1BH85_9GAMM|nr:insulinase family protein [Ferrimonas sediminicola]TKB49835.1 insulinase family protein [Ferrimonas sediminicola]